jgi:hypothetical protein
MASEGRDNTSHRRRSKIAVVGAWSGVINLQMPPALFIRPMHGQHGVTYTHCNFLRQRRPNFKAMHSYSASRTNSATGKRLNSVCTRRRPPIDPSRVKMFFHVPCGRSTVVEPQLPPSFSGQRGTNTATESPRKYPTT